MIENQVLFSTHHVKESIKLGTLFWTFLSFVTSKKMISLTLSEYLHLHSNLSLINNTIPNALFIFTSPTSKLWISPCNNKKYLLSFLKNCQTYVADLHPWLFSKGFTCPTHTTLETLSPSSCNIKKDFTKWLKNLV